MAKIFKHDGNVCVLWDEEQERLNPVPEGADVVEFDHDTNKDLVRSLNGGGGFKWQDHDVVAGKIVRKGSQFSVAADKPIERKGKEARGLIKALESGRASDAQTQKAIAFLLRQHFRENG